MFAGGNRPKDLTTKKSSWSCFKVKLREQVCESLDKRNSEG